jgi:hypothetical protein
MHRLFGPHTLSTIASGVFLVFSNLAWLLFSQGRDGNVGPNGPRGARVSIKNKRVNIAFFFVIYRLLSYDSLIEASFDMLNVI